MDSFILFLERTINQVLQSSKVIKNNTAISDGTVSVAFAAVQYMRENIRIRRKIKGFLYWALEKSERLPAKTLWNICQPAYHADEPDTGKS